MPRLNVTSLPGKYATDLFTEEAVSVINQHNQSQPLFLYLAHLAVHASNSYAPLQAPEQTVDKFDFIEDDMRQKYAAMLWKLDESVGQIVEALQTNHMLQNSIILFSSDNGGAPAGFGLNYGSNWPLRGRLKTLTSETWFGPSGRNETAPETELDVILAMVLNSTAANAVRTINPEAFSSIEALRLEAEVECGPVPDHTTEYCNSQEHPCLFHIPSDPCECNNVASMYPEYVDILKTRLEIYSSTMVPLANKERDPNGDPRYWGYTSTNWLDYPSPL
ncbi:Arylsulfatase B [Chionoecetes opilio]|uniref:Arylsulfatase B n=1 Tax=Chionoecetes opilio TaxID=41210 RepID=A0A8J5CWC1_CHIOP|nr:Arylsulfatase B [Chionoecetes opilio]